VRRQAAAVFTALLLAGAATACSDDSSNGESQSTTSTTASVCDQRTAVSDAVDELKNVNVIEDGTSSLEPAIDDVKQAVDALGESAESEIQPEVDAVKSSLSELESAIGDVASNGLQPVATAAAATGEAASKLVTELEALPCD
jgi:hypothetical protein